MQSSVQREIELLLYAWALNTTQFGIMYFYLFLHSKFDCWTATPTMTLNLGEFVYTYLFPFTNLLRDSLEIAWPQESLMGGFPCVVCCLSIGQANIEWYRELAPISISIWRVKKKSEKIYKNETRIWHHIYVSEISEWFLVLLVLAMAKQTLTGKRNPFLASNLAKADRHYRWDNHESKRHIHIRFNLS